MLGMCKYSALNLVPHLQESSSLQQACMHPNVQATEWNIPLSKYHIPYKKKYWRGTKFGELAN